MSPTHTEDGENLEMESNGSQIAKVSTTVNGSDVTGNLLLEPVDFQEEQEKKNGSKLLKFGGKMAILGGNQLVNI